MRPMLHGWLSLPALRVRTDPISLEEAMLSLPF